MPSQLESALVLRLRSPIKWEAALTAPSTGTLTPVDAAKPFSPLDYLQRDRELMFRDVTVAAAILDASIEVSNVWERDVDRPSLQGPVMGTLPLDRAAVTSTGTNLSMVRHVHNASIPLDAAQFADADLYGRDALIYEVLARACQVFTHPPVVTADSTGTLISLNGTSAWSLAEGVEKELDVNSALTLQRDAFKDADRHLADRDNQLAAYAARLAQVLKNPFAYALRLYVRAEGGVAPYVAETYVLVNDTDTERVWQAEPGLNNRFRIIYNKTDSTLQWFREQTDELHVPQLYAMTIPGIEANQVLNTIPDVPDPQDCQYWRSKAGQVIPDGISVHDTASYLDWTAGSDASGGARGGITQPDGASLTVPGVLTFHVPGTVAGKISNPIYNQYYRVAVLTQPNSLIEVTGGQNISDTNGTNGGATWDANVVSVGTKDYLVTGGDGIIYRGETYFPGDTFKGNSSTSNYTQVNVGFPSSVRQQVCNWAMSLPPGPWSLRMEYTNISGDASGGFGVNVSYSQGASRTDVIPDSTPLPFTADNGVLVTTGTAYFDVQTVAPAVVGVSWNYGDGQFHVRRLIFESTHISTGSYAIDCQLANGTASVNVTGINKLSEVMLWELPVTGNHSADIVLNWTDAPSCPVRFKQVQIQMAGSYSPTPNSFNFGGWRLECLDRAERVIQRGYAATIVAYGTNLVTQCPDNIIVPGQVWTKEAHGLWMGLVEVKNPRLRDLDSIAGTGIRTGRQYEVTSGLVTYGSGLYHIGDKFYGTVNDGESYTGGVVKQIGALMKARPGHIGRPCLVPQGIYLDSGGVVRALLTVDKATPVFVSCQPWMLDIGAYVVQEEFWMPEYYDRWDTDATAEAERVLIQTAVNPVGGGSASGGGMLRVGSLGHVTEVPNPSDPHNTWAFVNWTDSTGAIVSTDPTYNFIVVEPQIFTANFSATPTGYLVTLLVDPVGGGTIDGATTGIYPYGTILSLTAVPTAGSFTADVGADIVIVMDESGSMGGEHNWVKSSGLAGVLDSYLKAAGIGNGSVPNRFGLVGFGGNGTHQTGHKVLIAGAEFVMTEGLWTVDWDAAVDDLTTSGSIEDGYSGMTTALTGYGWRTSNVGKVIILCTDEPRNTKAWSTNPGMDTNPPLLASIMGSLTSGDYIAAVCTTLKIYDNHFPTAASDPPTYHTTVKMGPVMGFGYDANTLTANGITYETATTNHSGVASPVGSVTPSFIGQLYYATGTATYYKSTGLTSADWVVSGSAFTTGTAGASGDFSSPGGGFAGSSYRTTYEAMVINAGPPAGTAVKGSEWDLAYLRTLQAYPSDTRFVDAFTAAFVDHIKVRIVQTLSWRFVQWTYGATHTSLNPFYYLVTGPVTFTAEFSQT